MANRTLYPKFDRLPNGEFLDTFKMVPTTKNKDRREHEAPEPGTTIRDVCEEYQRTIYQLRMQLEAKG